ncbi:MAG: hypothetical protein ACI8X3_002115 [Saprospiraceae bacterium]|jgi:hypothetical protein
MKKLNPFFLMLFAILIITACGTNEKTEEEKAAEKITDATDKLTDNLENISKNIEGGLAGALSQIEDAVGNLQDESDTKKKPLNFRKLKELLPESTSGFSRTSSSGESTGMAGFNVSTAKAKYEDGDKKVDVDIVDAGGIGMAMMGLAAWSMVEIDKESDNGFERTTTYKGNKAFEKCDNERCEFSVFVAKRFIMTIKGRGKNITIDDLHDIANGIGLDNLEDLKDEEG